MAVDGGMYIRILPLWQGTLVYWPKDNLDMGAKKSPFVRKAEGGRYAA